MIDVGGQSSHMADPIHPDTLAEDQRVSAQDLHRLLVQRTEHDTGVASELLMRLGSLFGKDAPRDHFTASSVSSKTSSLTDVNSLGQETESTMWSSFGPKYLHRERTDSEKAVKGAEDESQIDGRVMFQEATVIELARHIPNDSSDELNRRGEEVCTFLSDVFPYGTRIRVEKHVARAIGILCSQDLFRNSDSWLEEATLTPNGA